MLSPAVDHDRPCIRNALLLVVHLLQEIQDAAGVAGHAVVGPGAEMVLPHRPLRVPLENRETKPFRAKSRSIWGTAESSRERACPKSNLSTAPTAPQLPKDGTSQCSSWPGTSITKSHDLLLLSDPNCSFTVPSLFLKRSKCHFHTVFSPFHPFP